MSDLMNSVKESSKSTEQKGTKKAQHSETTAEKLGLNNPALWSFLNESAKIVKKNLLVNDVITIIFQKRR